MQFYLQALDMQVWLGGENLMINMFTSNLQLVNIHEMDVLPARVVAKV